MTARARKVRRNLMSAEDIKLSLYEEKKRKPPPAQTSDDFRKPPMLRKPLMLHCLHAVHWKPRILFWPSTNCTFCNLCTGDVVSAFSCISVLVGVAGNSC